MILWSNSVKYLLFRDVLTRSLSNIWIPDLLCYLYFRRNVMVLKNTNTASAHLQIIQVNVTSQSYLTKWIGLPLSVHPICQYSISDYYVDAHLLVTHWQMDIRKKSYLRMGESASLWYFKHNLFTSKQCWWFLYNKLSYIAHNILKHLCHLPDKNIPLCWGIFTSCLKWQQNDWWTTKLAAAAKRALEEGIGINWYIKWKKKLDIYEKSVENNCFDLHGVT